MKIENIQLVTHLGCHNFNEKKITKKSAQKWLRSVYNTYSHTIIIRKLKLNFTLRYLYVLCSLALPCYSQMYTNCVYRQSLSIVGFIIIIHNLISDSFRKNNSLHDPRSTTNIKVLIHCFLFS